VLEDVWVGDVAGDGSVQLHATDDVAEGSFRCAECGYGVSIAAALPPCPMCAGRVWEAVER
jgi:hypothetical protein